MSDLPDIFAKMVCPACKQEIVTPALARSTRHASLQADALWRTAREMLKRHARDVHGIVAAEDIAR